MRELTKSTRWQVAVLVILAGLGLGSTAYILANQSSGLPNPLADYYRVNAEVIAANGLRPNVGVPVNVAGVRVGQVVGVTSTTAGTARIALRIERRLLQRVHADARAALEPITPLKDLSVDLRPGGPPAPPMADEGTIPVARTTAPNELATILAALDTDTRAFLTSLITATGATQGDGPALRRALRALGPTVAQTRVVTQALAERRRELARLVHNVAAVTRAASRDERLAAVVRDAERTLSAVAARERPLSRALAGLPGTLRRTHATLDHAGRFADELGPTLRALQPAVDRLPDTLAQLRSFADVTRPVLARQVRPLAREARATARDLSAAVPRLSSAVPQTTSVLQSAQYVLNELAFNPDGDDEGFLHWTSWFFHNWLSLVSTGDAHGTTMRTVPFMNCVQAQGLASAVNEIVRTAFNLSNLCGGTR